MPKLKSLTCEDVIEILSQFGFEIASQRGYAKLRRVLSDGRKQIITILWHRELTKVRRELFSGRRSDIP